MTIRSVARRAASLSHAALVLGLLAGPAQARAADTAASAEDSGSQILVTGARATGRTVATSAAPIDVLDARALNATGQPNLLEALNVTLPSFNLPARVQPDLGSMIRAGQLRNLDPSYTLTLVNGKRRHTTAVVNEDGFPGSVAVDLSLIPQEAIGRVEVLRDGASAIYGSDAIAGVINVILREDAGFTASSQIGQTYAGDGTSGNVRAGYGWKSDRGFFRVDGELAFQNIAVRNFGLNASYLSYPAINASGQPVKLGTNNSLPAGATANPAEANRNASPWINVGVPRSRTGNLSINGRYELTDDVNAYVFGTFSHRTAQSAQNFRLPNTIFQNNAGLLSVYPNGFTPYETTDETDFSVTGGLSGKLSGWDWDLSNTYGRDYIHVGVTNSANYSLTYPGGQTDFYIGNRNYSRYTANLDLHRQITGLFADPADISFGGEFSREHAELNAGEPNSYYGSGASSLVGYLPVDQSHTSRHNFAGYAGLSFKPVHRLLIDLAGRVEHYSDFGSNVSGRLSARYDFNDVFALRGTVSNGFHAPSLVTESYSNTSDHNGTPYKLAQPDSAAARALGATPLRPERSRNYTVGFTINPSSRIHLAVDAYQIEIDNRLGVSSNIGIDYSSGAAVDGTGKALTSAQAAAITSLLTNAGLSVGQGIVVHYFTNVGNTRTRGIDATLDGSLPLGQGTLRWNLAANFNGTVFTRVAPVPAALAGLPNITILSASQQASIQFLAPKDKQIAGLTYDIGLFSFTARETRYGPVTRLNSNTGTFYGLGALYTTDLAVTAHISKNVDLTLGGNNVFDRKTWTVPTFARSASNIAQYTGSWDNTGPVGVLGGSYYARLGVKFR